VAAPTVPAVERREYRAGRLAQIGLSRHDSALPPDASDFWD
jgi:hypothetical protein